MAPKAKQSSVRAARAKALAEEARVVRANARKKCRRNTLNKLNVLGEEAGVQAISFDAASDKKVSSFIRQLGRRCGSDCGKLRRVRALLLEWQANGGALIGTVLPELPGAPEDEPDHDGHEDGVVSLEPPVVDRHALLTAGYRLQTKAFMLTYNSKDFNLNTWTRFRSFIKASVKRFGATEWSACLEETLGAKPSLATPRDVYHFHAYLLWKTGEGIRLHNTDPFAFEAVRPRIDSCYVTNPKVFLAAAHHGLWYVSVMKLGTVKTASNVEPWRNYSPRPEWLVGLWTGGKLTHEQFETLSARFRRGHDARMRDLAAVRRSEKTTHVKEHVRAELALLEDRGALLPVRSFQSIDSFVCSFSYKEPPLWRRPLLALIGATGMGKSMLAADVLLRIGKLLGVHAFTELTVEDDGHLDASEFDVNKDAGILLDGVGDVMLLHTHREVLQGRPKSCKGGRSATMVYAYPYTLARRAIIATFDLSATNLHLFSTHHWLSNPKNVVVIRLDSPAWISARLQAPAADTHSQRELASAWTADEVAMWLQSCGAGGIASTLQANAVDGSDLLAFSNEDELVKDLRLTQFAARKLLQLRERELPKV